MNKKQREGAAKYLYGISKGIALVAIVGNFTRETRDFFNILIITGFALVTKDIEEE